MGFLKRSVTSRPVKFTRPSRVEGSAYGNVGVSPTAKTSMFPAAGSSARIKVPSLSFGRTKGGKVAK